MIAHINRKKTSQQKNSGGKRKRLRACFPTIFWPGPPGAQGGFKNCLGMLKGFRGVTKLEPGKALRGPISSGFAPSARKASFKSRPTGSRPLHFAAFSTKVVMGSRESLAYLRQVAWTQSNLISASREFFFEALRPQPLPQTLPPIPLSTFIEKPVVRWDLVSLVRQMPRRRSLQG